MVVVLLHQQKKKNILRSLKTAISDEFSLAFYMQPVAVRRHARICVALDLISTHEAVGNPYVVTV